MAFAKASDVQADAERAGMLRAATHRVDADVRAVSELRSCRLRDWSASDAPNLDLEGMGFESIDLSDLGQLQSTLEHVRQAGRVTPADASAIRREMRGYSATLSSGKRLRLLASSLRWAAMIVAEKSRLDTAGMVHDHENDVGHPDKFDCGAWCIGKGSSKGVCTVVAAPSCAKSAKCVCD